MSGQDIWKKLRSLGLPGVLGLALLGVVAWAHWQWLPARQDEVQVQASRVRQMRAAMRQLGERNSTGQAGGDAKSGASALAKLPPDAAWQTVWDALPDASQRVSLLQAISHSASKLGVNSQSIQYRGSVESWSTYQGQALWRQRVAMPVEGRYGDVRAWLGTLLGQSALSLDALELNRSDTTADWVKGRVSLSVWWRVSQAGSETP